MKKAFLFLLICLTSLNCFSQLENAEKFAKTISAEELKEH